MTARRPKTLYDADAQPSPRHLAVADPESQPAGASPVHALHETIAARLEAGQGPRYSLRRRAATLVGMAIVPWGLICAAAYLALR